MGAIDLEAYFRRVGYSGPRGATFDVLQAVHRAHVGAIPFESLSPLLGRPVELSPQALEDKLVRHARGGYCFEQNGLFFHVLESLGIRATPLAARVRWKLPEDAPQSPLSHRLAIAHLENGDSSATSVSGDKIRRCRSGSSRISSRRRRTANIA